MISLFTDTGVQIVCVPLPPSRRYTTAQIGYGWQYCRLNGAAADDVAAAGSAWRDVPYVQWQIVQERTCRLFLAIDTTLGDPQAGHVCSAETMAGDHHVVLEGLVDLTGEPLVQVPRIELCFRAATAEAGDVLPIDLIVDFGNSRSGALLLETSTDAATPAKMTPFELLDRFRLDAWDSDGRPRANPAAQWFSSKTRWCDAPYLAPQPAVVTESVARSVRSFWGRKTVFRERQRQETPRLFEDLSLARVGREADDLGQHVALQGDLRLGLSSPKRYLWAGDHRWLEGAFWHMADPYDRSHGGTFSTKLAGRLLAYLDDDTSAPDVEGAEAISKNGGSGGIEKLNGGKNGTAPSGTVKNGVAKNGTEKGGAAKNGAGEKTGAPSADEGSPAPVVAPAKPRYAPRTMMTAALYELLCQAYCFANSPRYRDRAGDNGRARVIRSLVLSYPSGMLEEERLEWRRQAERAIRIFSRTLGKRQAREPVVHFGIDEAGAVHLTYLWSEWQLLGRDPRLWFSLVGRPRPVDDGADGGTASGPSGERGAAARRGPFDTAGEADESLVEDAVRIACIDIGGGTSNLMIAEYRCRAGIDDAVRGRVLDRDGTSTAGDYLIKRLLERIIVPAFVEAVGLEPADALVLFGPEVPRNRGFRARRIEWMNRLFLPLAEAYLRRATDPADAPNPSHVDPDLVDPAVLESLGAVCNQLRGIGYYNLRQELRLPHDPARLEEVVREVFEEPLAGFCEKIAAADVDVVLLAGRPTKLPPLRAMLERMLPLAESRIVSMHRHYAGNWYPYQENGGGDPGRIADPKSAVVVGAAIQFLARNGRLPHFRFECLDREQEASYTWGVMIDAERRIRRDRILFRPIGEGAGRDCVEFRTASQRVLIGRVAGGIGVGQASPTYLLTTESDGRVGTTEIEVRLRRVRGGRDAEEHLVLESVAGTVAGEPAQLEQNVFFRWHTLADERFFLDTGGLDRIEPEGATCRPTL